MAPAVAEEWEALGEELRPAAEPAARPDVPGREEAPARDGAGATETSEPAGGTRDRVVAARVTLGRSLKRLEAEADDVDTAWNAYTFECLAPRTPGGLVTHVFPSRRGAVGPRPQGRIWFVEKARRESAWRREWERSSTDDSGCGARWRELERDIGVVLRRRNRLQDQAVDLGLEPDEVLELLSPHRLAIWWD